MSNTNTPFDFEALIKDGIEKFKIDDERKEKLDQDNKTRYKIIADILSAVTLDSFIKINQERILPASEIVLVLTQSLSAFISYSAISSDAANELAALIGKEIERLVNTCSSYIKYNPTEDTE